MKTTVTLQTTLVKDILGYKEKLNFKSLGQVMAFFTRNAISHIKKRGYDSFLMKNEETQLTTPMYIPQVGGHRERLYNNSLNSSLRKSPLMWHFWVYCLDTMQEKKTEITISKGKTLIIEPGSFLSTRSKMKDETGLLTEKTVRTGVDTLKRHGMITTKSCGNTGSLISVVGY